MTRLVLPNCKQRMHFTIFMCHKLHLLGNSAYKIRSVVVDEWYREKVGDSLAHLIKAIRIKATAAAVCVLSTIVAGESLPLRF